MFLPVLKKHYDEKLIDCRAVEINCTIKLINQMYSHNLWPYSCTRLVLSSLPQWFYCFNSIFNYYNISKKNQNSKYFTQNFAQRPPQAREVRQIIVDCGCRNPWAAAIHEPTFSWIAAHALRLPQCTSHNTRQITLPLVHCDRIFFNLYTFESRCLHFSECFEILALLSNPILPKIKWQNSINV